MPTRLIDIVFPAETNHHGTLFGGAGLAQMDKVAFIAATRHGRIDFVTASCERIDFRAPAYLGEIVETTGRVTRVGRRSMSVEVDLYAEVLLTGERRHCSRGLFNMVAVVDPAEPGFVLSPLTEAAEAPEPEELRMVEIVFPEGTSHYGSLYGGNALAAMSKAAFVAATRRCRQSMVLVSTRRVDFTSHIYTGEIMEVRAAVARLGTRSVTVAVSLWAENLRTGEARRCGEGEFVLAAVDAGHRPMAIHDHAAV